MNKESRIIDLIYLTHSKYSDIQLAGDYRGRLKLWENWLEKKHNENSDSGNAFIDEQNEYIMIENLIRHFIHKRLDWIEKSVTDPNLKKKYLRLFPPFCQNRKIKEFLFHFFQIKESNDGNEIDFYFLNKSEKELRILWDIYKLTRTLQSIEIIQTHLNSPRGSFVPSLGVEHSHKTLENLKNAIHLLIKICVKPKYLEQILEKFPKSAFTPSNILKRKTSNSFLINDIVLEKFDYRNYFFHIYFKPNIKAIYLETEYTFDFNYLDYEIIRQEFLIDWIHNKLKDNISKEKILKKYTVGTKNFFEIIQKDPKMEITLLKRLPKDEFNDIISDVNEAVEESFKTPVDPMSDNFGEFSILLSGFKKALKLAKKPIEAFEQYLKKNRSDELDQQEARLMPSSKNEGGMKKSVSEYQIKIIPDQEVSFSFFCERNSDFKKQHSLLQARMGPRHYGMFNRSINKILSSVTKNKIIIRRTPRHEWSVPYIITEMRGDESFEHFLILGAEVQNKQLGMGYSSKIDNDLKFIPYFVYGTKTLQPEYGNPIEERTVKGVPYTIYSFNSPSVVEKVIELTEKMI